MTCFWSSSRALLELDAIAGCSGDDGVGPNLKIVQVLGVAQCGRSARCHHLGFEPVGLHLTLEVVHDVQSDHLDAFVGFGDGFSIGVTPFHHGLHLFRFPAEHRIKQAIQRVRSLDGQFR